MRKLSFSGGLFLGLSLVVSIPGSLPAQSNVIVRVMSANLTSGNAQQYDTPGLNILKGLKPDVVAIQEFNYAGNGAGDFDTMVTNTFGPEFTWFRESGFSLPNGIISRYPIKESGSWPDAVVSNRGFAWARIGIPGSNDLYLVSVHLYSSGTDADRNTQALEIKAAVLSNFPPDAWVIVAGDFNTGARTDSAVNTFKTFLSDSPIPADPNGNDKTNASRKSPYDYVLPSFTLTNALRTVNFPAHSYPNGLVFDSRVYTNGPMDLDDFAPVALGDSGAVNMQHMGVVKDFLIAAGSTAPAITTQPQSQNAVQGSNATFTVVATGEATLAYQWRLFGAELAEATSNSYTITNVQPGAAGDYTVVVTNGFGAVTSSIATLAVISAPIISAQPQSLSVNAGQDASFSVSATGVAPVSYQWHFNGSDISGANSSTYTVVNAQTNDAGDYSVVISNVFGSLPSSNAILTVVAAPGSVIAQWRFNDTTASVSSPPPTIGSGTVSLVGGTTSMFVGGSGSTDTNLSNNAWNTFNYPAQGNGNKTAGARFSVSTAGRQNISVSWDEKVSQTGSKYVRLQYSTNGSTFVDSPTATTEMGVSVFEPKSVSLAGIAAVNNNSNFAVRVVSEFESTAVGTTNNNYVAVGTSYAGGGTIRFDMFTISGSLIAGGNPPPAPATLSAPFINGAQQFQFTITGTAGSNYVVQAADEIAASNWVSLVTNVSPFTFIETNSSLFLQRYYRAVAFP